MTSNRSILVFGLLLALQPVRAALGSDDLTLLDVRQKQIELREVRTSHERNKQLFEEGLTSQSELDRSESRLQLAQLNYQRAVLALVRTQPRVTVRSAVKYRGEGGERFVRLTLQNLAQTVDEVQMKILTDFEGSTPIPDELVRRDLADVFVSLKDAAVDEMALPTRGVVIALPYEHHVARLAHADQVTLDYQLLKDVDRVQVVAEYQGRTQSVGVQLQQAKSDSLVTLSATQISQEADLGSAATYELLLERPTIDVKNFSLRVLGLPLAITSYFVDLESGARVSQISFPPGVSSLRLGLKLFLPETPDAAMPLDRPTAFWPVALDPAQAAKWVDKLYTEAQLAALRVGAVRLEIIPRGLGRLAVSAPSLFSEVTRGESSHSQITFRNIGSRDLRNVMIETEYPLHWTVRLEPSAIAELAVNEEVRVDMTVSPPPDVAVGEYEVRIKTESFSMNRPVPTEDKIFRLSVVAKSNWAVTVVLVTTIALLLATILIVGTRLSRR